MDWINDILKLSTDDVNAIVSFEPDWTTNVGGYKALLDATRTTHSAHLGTVLKTRAPLPYSIKLDDIHVKFAFL